MAKRKKQGGGQWINEISLDNLPEELVEKIVSGNVFHDPVFDAVAAQQDLEWFSNSLQWDEYDHAAEIVDHGDSTVVNRFWELHALYGGQWIIRKRAADKRHYRKVIAVRDNRKARNSVVSCSGLRQDRSRCRSPAKYVYATKRANSWSYQRRCDSCFVKVRDKSKYRPLNDGRYFRGGLHGNDKSELV